MSRTTITSKTAPREKELAMAELLKKQEKPNVNWDVASFTWNNYEERGRYIDRAIAVLDEVDRIDAAERRAMRELEARTKADDSPPATGAAAG